MQDDRHPLDAEAFTEEFVEEERQMPVLDDSPLGQAMVKYRERLTKGEVERLDPSTWRVDPVPVNN